MEAYIRQQSAEPQNNVICYNHGQREPQPLGSGPVLMTSLTDPASLFITTLVIVTLELYVSGESLSIYIILISFKY